MANQLRQLQQIVSQKQEAWGKEYQDNGSTAIQSRDEKNAFGGGGRPAKTGEKH